MASRASRLITSHLGVEHVGFASQRRKPSRHAPAVASITRRAITTCLQLQIRPTAGRHAPLRHLLSPAPVRINAHRYQSSLPALPGRGSPTPLETINTTSASTAATATSTTATATGSPSSLKSPDSVGPAGEPVVWTETGSAAKSAGTTLDELVDLDALKPGAAEMSLGDLRTLGLDFGWGPTSMMQWFLEHVHVYTGTPWWASIILTVVVVRLAIFPFTWKNSESAAVKRALNPVIEPLQARLKKAKDDGNNYEAMKVRQEMRSVYKFANISFTSTLVPLVLNTVVGFSTFRLLRGMSALPYDGFDSGGLLWINSLNLADPYYICPTIMAASVWGSMQIQEASSQATSPDMRRAMKVVANLFPVISFVVTSFQSAALQLAFVTSSLMILIISATLRNPAARRLLRLTPNYSAAPATGSKALRIQVRAAIDDVKAAAAVPAKPKPGVGPFVERLAEQVSTPFRRKKAEPPASITYPKVDRAQPKPRAKRSKAAIMEAEDYEERRQQDMRALMSMRQQHTKPAGQDKFL